MNTKEDIMKDGKAEMIELRKKGRHKGGKEGKRKRIK